LEPNHTLIAIGLDNLAQLLMATNRLAEAEPLMRRPLDVDEKGRGPNHPQVALHLNNLATLLLETNSLTEAESLVRRALSINEKSFGPNHPDVAIRLNNLARLLQATNRLAEAEPLMHRHVTIFAEFTRRTGHPHPHLETAFQNYAVLLASRGKSSAEIGAEIEALKSPILS
jgi:tetratricopeptide (TPR) repeat protein